MSEERRKLNSFRENIPREMISKNPQEILNKLMNWCAHIMSTVHNSKEVFNNKNDCILYKWWNCSELLWGK